MVAPSLPSPILTSIPWCLFLLYLGLGGVTPVTGVQSHLTSTLTGWGSVQQLLFKVREAGTHTATRNCLGI